MKTRTTVELLVILRNHIRKYSYTTGLCLEIWKLLQNGDFSLEEQRKIWSFVKENRPEYVHINSPYYWPSGDAEPRLEWLDSQIAKHMKLNPIQRFIKNMFNNFYRYTITIMKPNQS